MRKLLGLILLLASPAWASWTLVQHPTSANCGTSNPCSITVSSTGSGHLIVVTDMYAAAAQRTISSVSGGGTYTVCTACAGFDASFSVGANAAYTLSSTSGTTTISVTLSGAITGARIAVREYSFTGSSIAFDVGGVRTATSCTACAGVTLTPTGTNDVIVQFGTAVNTFTAVTSPYSTSADFPGGNGIGDALNTSDGTAPTWTQNTNTEAQLAGIAFSETTGGGGGTVVKRHHGWVMQ